MQAFLSPNYLRLFLVILVPSYFSFLLIAALVDWRLARICTVLGIDKSHHFIVANMVPKPVFDTMINRLGKASEVRRRMILWLRIWRFVSDIFFWLFAIFFVTGVFSLSRT